MDQRHADNPSPWRQWRPGSVRLRERVGRNAVSLVKTWQFWVRLLVALVLIVVSVYTNRQFLGWGLLAVFAIMVVPLGRARSFLIAFVPYATLWFVFTFLRSFADETKLAEIWNTKVSHLERWIFGGELPTVVLQSHFYDPHHLHPWDYYFVFVHWSYFLIPHVVMAWMWWKHPRIFRRAFLTLALVLFAGLVLYFLIPSNPPWMAPETVNTPASATALRIMEPIARQLGGGLYQAGYKVVGESNPIAAMPSIHFAVTFILFWIARARGRFWTILAAFYALSMGFGLVYLGEHYVVDVAAGGLITTASWSIAGAWLRHMMGEHAASPIPASAPAAPPVHRPQEHAAD